LDKWNIDYSGESVIIEPTFGSATLTASPVSTQTSSISQQILVNFVAINITFRIACFADFIPAVPIPLPTLTDQKAIGKVGVQIIDSGKHYKTELDCQDQPGLSKLNETQPYFYVTQQLDTSELKNKIVNLTLYATRSKTNVNHTVVGLFYQLIPILYPPFTPRVPTT